MEFKIACIPRSLPSAADRENTSANCYCSKQRRNDDANERENTEGRDNRYYMDAGLRSTILKTE